MLKLAAVLALALAGAIVSPTAEQIPAPVSAIDLAAAQHNSDAVVRQDEDAASVIREPSAPLTELFEQAVEGWIAALAAEQQFARWHNVDWERYPLGPGLHGWVVILSDEEGECGYLVVSGYPDGQFQLAEYGAGPYPLFSEQTLHRSLADMTEAEGRNTGSGVELFAERHYFSPLQHVWRVVTADEDFILDAKTGERFELTADDLAVLDSINDEAEVHTASLLNARQPAALDKIADATQFDPYFDLGWLTKTSLNIKDLQQLQALLDQQTALTFVSDTYNGQVTTAYAVTGYHQWVGGPPYIALYNDFGGSRYVPAQFVMHTGEFHIAHIPSPIEE